MSSRKYRKTIGNGIVPLGDKAWCVHCDEYQFEGEKPLGPVPCHPAKCGCTCHTRLRKPKCLCAVVMIENPWDSPMGCCLDCGCFCHIAEEKEENRTRKTREAAWKAELKRREDERFEKEGVRDWEKKTLEFLLLDPTALNLKYRNFVEALTFSSDSGIKKVSETGTEFMKRMMATPWGSTYIKVQGLHLR